MIADWLRILTEATSIANANGPLVKQGIKDGLNALITDLAFQNNIFTEPQLNKIKEELNNEAFLRDYRQHFLYVISELRYIASKGGNLFTIEQQLVIKQLYQIYLDLCIDKTIENNPEEYRDRSLLKQQFVAQLSPAYANYKKTYFSLIRLKLSLQHEKKRLEEKMFKKAKKMGLNEQSLTDYFVGQPLLTENNKKLKNIYDTIETINSQISNVEKIINNLKKGEKIEVDHLLNLKVEFQNYIEPKIKEITGRKNIISRTFRYFVDAILSLGGSKTILSSGGALQSVSRNSSRFFNNAISEIKQVAKDLAKQKLKTAPKPH